MVDDFFAGLIGHEELKKRFSRLIETGRMPQASLFSGPPGVGKTVAAGAVASALVGHSVLKNIDFSEAHESLHDGEDVFYIAPEKTVLRTGQFRKLQEIIALRGNTGSCRVFIIDHVETMNSEFANRMLKTLEEPVPGVYFILITNRPAILLPTVVSRCVSFHFKPVSAQELSAALVFRFGGKTSDYMPLLALCGGNVREVLRYVKDGNLPSTDKAFFFLKTVKQSAIPYAEWTAFAATLKEADSVELLKQIAVILRDLLLLRTGVATEYLQLKQNERLLADLAPQWSDKELTDGVLVIETALEAAARHVNMYLIWDYVCISFLRGRGDS